MRVPSPVSRIPLSHNPLPLLPFLFFSSLFPLLSSCDELRTGGYSPCFSLFFFVIYFLRFFFLPRIAFPLPLPLHESFSRSSLSEPLSLSLSLSLVLYLATLALPCFSPHFLLPFTSSASLRPSFSTALSPFLSCRYASLFVPLFFLPEKGFPTFNLFSFSPLSLRSFPAYSVIAFFSFVFSLTFISLPTVTLFPPSSC